MHSTKQEKPYASIKWLTAINKFCLSGLWDDKIDKNHNIQKRELQTIQFARNGEKEQDFRKHDVIYNQ